MLVSMPSRVRTYASTSMSSRLSSRRRQSPSIGGPVAPISPFSGLPPSRSFELKWMVRLAAMDSVSGEGCHPESSMASIRTSPSVTERLMTRTKLSRWGFDADTTNETARTVAAASENSNPAPRFRPR